ncbi:oligosaccharide flippase family protein [Streptomyces monticola]|uniref:Oligosaccharide flippase family protein n=1 Tax=Streptomyces monticola TaxID=2666263 RepID=A0ABW2JJT7_9ACTN
MSGGRVVLRGLGWSYAGSVAAVLVLLGYTACTARLVSPATFGQYALAATVITVFGHFSNAGLATCLLRADVLTRQLLRGAWLVAAQTGLVCCAAVQGVALLAAARWHGSEAVGLLRLLALQLLLGPAASVALAALRRIGRARAAALLETCGQITGCAAGLTLLGAGWSPWGLAATGPVSCLVLLTGALLARPRALPDGERVPPRELLGQSGFFAGLNLAQSLTNNAPLWCSGALFGPTATGHLSRASLCTGIPLTALATGLQRATAPVLAEARAAHSGRVPRQTVHDLMCAASAAAFLGFGAVAGAGPGGLGLLLGPGWDTAAALLPALAVGAACALLYSAGISLDEVRRDPRACVTAQSAVVAATLALLALAALTRSVTVLALATAAPALGHAVQLKRWLSQQVVAVRPLLRAHTAHATAGTALCAAGHLAAPAGALGSTAAVLAVAAACWPLRSRLPVVEVVVRRGLIPRRHTRTLTPAT